MDRWGAERKMTARLDSTVFDRLACPACLGRLSLASSEMPELLVCAGCGRAYPVDDGIPVLIAERARQGCLSPMVEGQHNQ
jgi:uncharacterized protein YbaR (Trm112 family)